MKVAAGGACRLKAQGVDVVDFGAGEPDFPTPQHIGDAAKAAIDANFTKYTTNSGTEELKRAMAARYREDYGVEYTTSEIIITAGGKQALLQRRDGAVRAGRRSHHAHAGLADAASSRSSSPRPRRSSSARTPEDGFRLRADTILARDHAAHARHHHQLAGQPDRRADFRRRTWRAMADEAARARHLDRARPLLREADLRPGRRTTCRGCWSSGCAIARCSAARRRRRTR